MNDGHAGTREAAPVRRDGLVAPHRRVTQPDAWDVEDGVVAPRGSVPILIPRSARLTVASVRTLLQLMLTA